MLMRRTLSCLAVGAIALSACGSSSSSTEKPAQTTTTTVAASAAFPALDNTQGSVLQPATVTAFVNYDNTAKNSVSSFDAMSVDDFLAKAPPVLDAAEQLANALKNEVAASVAKGGSTLTGGVDDARAKIAMLRANPSGNADDARNDVRFVAATVEGLEFATHVEKTKHIAVPGTPALAIPEDWSMEDVGGLREFSSSSGLAKMRLAVLTNAQSLPPSPKQLLVGNKVYRADIGDHSWVVRFTSGSTDYEVTATTDPATNQQLPRLLGVLATFGTL